MKVFALLAVFVLLTASSGLWASEVPRQSLAFHAKNAVHLDCNIHATKFGLWNLRVSAFDPHKRRIFSYLYSIHDNVKGSMNDCDSWMKAAKKKIAGERRPRQSTSQRLLR